MTPDEIQINLKFLSPTFFTTQQVLNPASFFHSFSLDKKEETTSIDDHPRDKVQSTDEKTNNKYRFEDEESEDPDTNMSISVGWIDQFQCDGGTDQGQRPTPRSDLQGFHPGHFYYRQTRSISCFATIQSKTDALGGHKK